MDEKLKQKRADVEVRFEKFKTQKEALVNQMKKIQSDISQIDVELVKLHGAAVELDSLLQDLPVSKPKETKKK